MTIRGRKDCEWVGRKPSVRCEMVIAKDHKKKAKDYCPCVCTSRRNFCVDEAGFFREKSQRESCEWVGENPKERCKLPDKLNPKKRAEDACPSVCNSRCYCRDDEDSFRFRSQKNFSCDKIMPKDCLKKAGRRHKRQGQLRIAADFCPKKCNSCYV